MELRLQFLIFTVLLGLVTEVTSQGDDDGCDMSMPYSDNHPCPRNLRPVCGTDTNTYHNECLFCQAKRKRMFEGDTSIRKSHEGSCDDGGKRPVPNQADGDLIEPTLTGNDLNIDNVLSYYRRVLDSRNRAASQGTRSTSQRSQESQRSQGSQRSRGSQGSRWSRGSQTSQRSQNSRRSQSSQGSRNSRRSQNSQNSRSSSRNFRSSRTSNNGGQRRRTWSWN